MDSKEPPDSSEDNIQLLIATTGRIHMKSDRGRECVEKIMME